jgi:hypoxanthine-DNA glycosylase
MQAMSRVQSFPPIASEKSKVLILGSMPGPRSLRVEQYYAHQRNAFWNIMGELFDAGPSLPYEERVMRLLSVGVALWDSLQECIRPGGLDAAIRDEVANDFAGFFKKHRNITHVFFNGGKAENAFKRHALPSMNEGQHIFQRLPSTSPANARMTLDAKVQAWRAVKKALTP